MDPENKQIQVYNPANNAENYYYAYWDQFLENFNYLTSKITDTSYYLMESMLNYKKNYLNYTDYPVNSDDTKKLMSPCNVPKCFTISEALSIDNDIERIQHVRYLIRLYRYRINEDQCVVQLLENELAKLEGNIPYEIPNNPQ